MNDAIMSMMTKYKCNSSEDYENALKEIVQEVALIGLSRSKFFNVASFYGGTALRIFHNLPRYSEDLDFSLIKPDNSFNLDEYIPYIERELLAYNFKMNVKKKEKTKDTAVQSAFIKGNTVQNILEITSNDGAIYGINPNALIKIKFEIDTNPPDGAYYQFMNSINPTPYQVRMYDLPSLFAGKIHAVLCRDYKNRVKGRDFFDYIWYLQKGCPVNIFHLQKRLEQSNKWNPDTTLTIEKLKILLTERFYSIDFNIAKNDVEMFLNPHDRESLSVWNSNFFEDITNRFLN
ncbi:MAG: nucleotidyl transferase AbiEii/AbiGii toxin family protein [Sphaerochaetaceae bacterium]|nr:nucleotidyl transferase AbiEii/AbiGii toxin family protein [Sphaerochaetaceae bacterium]